MTYKIKIITLNSGSLSSLELIDSIIKQGLEVSFFDAIDGRKEKPKLSKSESINQKKCFEYRLSYLSNSEIGCYLSHYRCIKEEYEKGTEKLCILEDDILIEPCFSANITLIFNLEDKYELVKLMALKKKKRKVCLEFDNGYKITRPTKGTLGTQGYIINRKGMEKVIKKAMPIYKPIDKFYDHFWASDIKTYSIEPHIIWEKESTTSVEKPKSIGRTNIKEQLLYRLNKLAKSLKGFIYRIKNLNSFYPNSKMKNMPFKTTRKLKK